MHTPYVVELIQTLLMLTGFLSLLVLGSVAYALYSAAQTRNHNRKYAVQRRQTINTRI